MEDVIQLSYTLWECKYHIEWISKYRKKVFRGSCEEFRRGALRIGSKNESEIIEWCLMKHYVHILISIPPKYLVSPVVGYIKGKRAIHIARSYSGQRKNFIGKYFWARGY